MRERLQQMIANEEAILVIYERTLARRNGGELIPAHREEETVTEAKRRIAMYKSLLGDLDDASG